MIKQLLTSLIIATAALTGAAQITERADKIDIDLSQLEVNVSLNPSHYRELLNRFEAADTLMRLDEMATAYYGYAYTFEYDPVIDYDYVDELLEKKAYGEAYAKATEALAADPVSLQLTVASLIAGTRDEANTDLSKLINLQQRFDMLVSTILSSGEGITPETPFVVIREDDIITLLTSVIGVSDIVDKASIGNVDAYKIRFGTSPREHILYFNNTPQHHYEMQHNITK